MLNPSIRAKANRINRLATVQPPGKRQIAHIFPKVFQKFPGKFPEVFERVEDD